jgi:hypothetical protein
MLVKKFKKRGAYNTCNWDPMEKLVEEICNSIGKISVAKVI